jgi:hypothetical protein
MSYTVQNPQPSGLQANETAVTLDSGDAVAVLVTGTPVDNNAGLDVYAQARAINTDGSTVMHGSVAMLTGGHHLASHDDLTSPGATLIGQAMLAAVLGEAMPMYTPSGATDAVPALSLSDAVLSAWSIRAMLGASTSGTGISAASLLT